MFTDPLIGSILAGYWLWSHLQSEAVTPEPSHTFETIIIKAPTPSWHVASILVILAFALAAHLLIFKLILTRRQREHKAIDESHISDSTTEREQNKIPEFDFTLQRPNKILDLEEHIADLQVVLQKEKHEANVNSMIRCAANPPISPKAIPPPVGGQEKDFTTRHMNEDELKEMKEELDRTYRSAMDDEVEYY